LQVTSALAAVAEAPAASLVELEVLLDSAFSLSWLLLFEVLSAFELEVLLEAEALLSTPPCPLQAPFPPLLVVPSLHVTSDASAAWTERGRTKASDTSRTDEAVDVRITDLL